MVGRFAGAFHPAPSLIRGVALDRRPSTQIHVSGCRLWAVSCGLSAAISLLPGQRRRGMCDSGAIGTLSPASSSCPAFRFRI